jgi:hypothetical protein
MTWDLQPPRPQLLPRDVINKTRAKAYEVAKVLRVAVENNVRNPSPESAADVERLGLEYRKALEAEKAEFAIQDRIEAELRAVKYPPKPVVVQAPVKKPSIAYAIGQGIGAALIAVGVMVGIYAFCWLVFTMAGAF